MAKKLRLGFVGAGMMGQLAHLANCALEPDVELVALAEGREATARLVAARYGVGATYPDHRAMLARRRWTPWSPSCRTGCTTRWFPTSWKRGGPA